MFRTKYVIHCPHSRDGAVRATELLDCMGRPYETDLGLDVYDITVRLSRREHANVMGEIEDAFVVRDDQLVYVHGP